MSIGFTGRALIAKDHPIASLLALLDDYEGRLIEFAWEDRESPANSYLGVWFPTQEKYDQFCETLEANGCVNVHPDDLPERGEGRGGEPDKSVFDDLPRPMNKI